MRDQVSTSPAVARSRYSALAIVLHWLIAALIVLQVVLAGRMEGPPTLERFAVFQLHKSIGITVLFLSLARLAWRLIHPPPPMPATLAPWERVLARWTHIGFYLVMIGMPLTGWIAVSASRIPLPTLLYGVIPWPMIPGLPDLAPHAKAAWHAFGQTSHGLIIKFAYVLIALHVAGALKHQLFDRDEPVLGRMAPGAITGRWREPRLLLIALAAVAVIAFGRLVQPPAPHLAAGPPPAAPATAIATAPPAAAVPQPQTPPPAAPQAPPVAAAPAAAAPVPAAAPSEAAAAPAAAAPVKWIVAPGSTLAFESAWSGQAVRGRFDRWRADVVFSPDALDRSAISVTVDIASITTGDAQRDGVLPSADWFDTAAHPQATFAARKFEDLGGGRFVAHGRLSLRGVSRPLDLPFRLAVTGKRAEAHGTAVIDRRVFGIGQGDFAATDQIPAEVKISFDLTARAAQ